MQIKHSLLCFSLLAVFGSAQWPRWEERTLDCTSQKGNCILVTPNSKFGADSKGQKPCRREPMPQNEWNKLVGDGTRRIVCPIGCGTENDLSVIQKRPTDNKNCQKYYTYGKHRDETEGQWYLWLAEPCVANLTTHCRFNDIPFPSNGTFKRTTK
ncbi:hypothetical protein niasHT_008905 [Heterodera trifolii]|uniref:DUF7808 domain-containing protein n=1 Tax=Heterodera trifolii TaxID=157864 RepID=A0ABD2LY53_9BILA